MNDELHEIKEDCLGAMTDAFESYARLYKEAGGDQSELAELVLEQWRP
jgi:hypothetical protein